MGTPVTEETIKSWYNPKKKGIIVVGMMRSGTQYLTTVIHDTLIKDAPKIDYCGEIPLTHYGTMHTAPESLIPKIISEFMWCDNFSVSSAVITQALPWLFNYWPIYETIEKNYTVIKVVRQDMSKHLMSTVVFNKARQHSGIVPGQLETILPTPYKLPVEDLSRFILERQYVLTLPADITVNYEDLVLPSTVNMVKNNYGITPEEFFKNHDFIAKTLGNTVFHGR